MQPKAVLFDLDNTLTHRTLSIERYADRFLQDFGHVVDSHPRRVSQLIGREDNGGYLQPGSPFSSIRQAVGCTLMQELTWRVPPAPHLLSEHWVNHFPGSAVAMPGAESLLNALSSRGIRVAVVSNGADDSRRRTVAALPFASLVEEVFSSQAVGEAKPAAAMFLAAAARLQVVAEDCWYVGDHPVNDYLGAQNAGMHAVWLRGFHQWPQAMAEARVSVSSLEALLVKLDAAAEACT